MARTGTPQINLSEDKKNIIVSYGSVLDRFNATWLRHNCRCITCVEPNSGQRMITEPGRLRPSYTLKQATVKDSDVEIEWDDEDHVGHIPLIYLKENSYSDDVRRQRVVDTSPTPCDGTLPRLSYEEVMNSEEGVWKWVKILNELGVCLIEGIPAEDGMAKKVAERIGALQKLFFGEVFHLKSIPKPVDLPNSNEKLSYHMDSVYYESPPGMQFLLCKRFDKCVEGGESTFVDAWYEAERLKEESPEDFDTLTRIPATFQSINYTRQPPVHFKLQKPHITVGPENQVIGITWEPAIEGPLCADEKDIEPYYKAYHKFANMLQHSKTKMQLRLEEGKMISFLNRRMLHSREGFELNGGTRLFEGCYINTDEFKSQVHILSKKYNNGKPAKIVFNNSGL